MSMELHVLRVGCAAYSGRALCVFVLHAILECTQPHNHFCLKSSSLYVIYLAYFSRFTRLVSVPIPALIHYSIRCRGAGNGRTYIILQLCDVDKEMNNNKNIVCVRVQMFKNVRPVTEEGNFSFTIHSFILTVSYKLSVYNMEITDSSSRGKKVRAKKVSHRRTASARWPA